MVAHYCIEKLGKLISSDNAYLTALEKQFQEWIPGKTKDVIENEIYKLYQNNPVDYWIEMAKNSRWKQLADIALRIILIPPTEAACEKSLYQEEIL